ncbi:MAG: ferritin-like domain-containing protein [Flavobacteriaceae bacterium]|nr:ferritin-like domain-containing protein [Flavobacteriaceae bacterium]
MSKKATTKASGTKKSESKAKKSTAKSGAASSKTSAAKSEKKSTKVKAKADAASSLRDLLLDGMKDLYWAENNLLKGLEQMNVNATSAKLKQYLEDHHTETQKHISRLEDAFEAMGEKAEEEKCVAMAGLLKEGESILKDTVEGAVRDAGIILASQKIEHYEIASYGSLAMFAKHLGEEKVEKLLRDTLNEEKATNNILTNLAVNEINVKA